MEPHDPAKPAQPAWHSSLKAEVCDPAAGDPDLIGHPARGRLGCRRATAITADEPAADHDQIRARVGRIRRNRARCGGALGGVLARRAHPGRLDVRITKPGGHAPSAGNELRHGKTAARPSPRCRDTATAGSDRRGTRHRYPMPQPDVRGPHAAVSRRRPRGSLRARSRGHARSLGGRLGRVPARRRRRLGVRASLRRPTARRRRRTARCR